MAASETNGAVYELSKKATNAKRCSWNNYILKNLLAKFSNVTFCSNASTTMRKVVTFANTSVKRHEMNRSLKIWLYKGYAKLVGLKGMIATCNFRAITWSKCVMPFTELQFECTTRP